MGTAVCMLMHVYVHTYAYMYMHMYVLSFVALCGQAATRVYRAVQSDMARLPTARGTQPFSAGVLAVSMCACLICHQTCSTEHRPGPGRPPRRRWHQHTSLHRSADTALP